jgi:hypothetical protein
MDVTGGAPGRIAESYATAPLCHSSSQRRAHGSASANKPRSWRRRSPPRCRANSDKADHRHRRTTLHHAGLAVKVSRAMLMRLSGGAWGSRSHHLRVPRATYLRLPASAPKLRRRLRTTCRAEPQPPERPACARAKCHRDAGGKCREAAQSRPWSCLSPGSRPPSAMRRGVGRAAIRIALRDMNHDRLSAVILFKVEPEGIAALEF